MAQAGRENQEQGVSALLLSLPHCVPRGRSRLQHFLLLPLHVETSGERIRRTDMNQRHRSQIGARSLSKSFSWEPLRCFEDKLYKFAFLHGALTISFLLFSSPDCSWAFLATFLGPSLLYSAGKPSHRLGLISLAQFPSWPLEVFSICFYKIEQFWIFYSMSFVDLG